MPTNAEAERLAHDLAAFLGADEVELFPAWETLPFERVSPSVETMGRRLRAMWRLPAARARTRRASPKVARRAGPRPAAAARAPRRGRRAGRGRPRATSSTRTSWSPGLVGVGYRREYQVEHRGEVAVRGSIVDVFASTADVPVRIDLWGDEVDRLTEFSVGDQRSTDDIAEVEMFGCRELLPDRRGARAGPRRWSATEPWGREQWERLAEGLVFDGMESWLPWLTDDEQVLVDLLPPDAQVLLVEPRRMRDRAAEHAGRGGRPGRHPGRDVGRRAADGRSPGCTCRSTGCWPTPRRRPGR